MLSAGFRRPILTEEMCDGFYPCYHHGVKGQYFTFALNHCGGIVFRWYRDCFSEEEKRRAGAEGRKAYDVMVEEMEDTPSGLLFLPHLNGSGTPYCDISARGSILGLTLSTTRAEVGKALLEGCLLYTSYSGPGGGIYLFDSHYERSCHICIHVYGQLEVCLLYTSRCV